MLYVPSMFCIPSRSFLQFCNFFAVFHLRTSDHQLYMLNTFQFVSVSSVSHKNEKKLEKLKMFVALILLHLLFSVLQSIKIIKKFYQKCGKKNFVRFFVILFMPILYAFMYFYVVTFLYVIIYSKVCPIKLMEIL